LIFYISRNRKTTPALDHSVRAVKADAARSLFSVKCDRIAWAILDTGIQADHAAFSDGRNGSRVVAAYDFGLIRRILSKDGLDAKTLASVKANAKSGGFSAKQVDDALAELRRDLDNELPVNWGLVERLIKMAAPSPPSNPHGTHVAGILGAGTDEKGGHPAGMCPEIQLYDFRVIAETLEETEFAIIAALQFIRFLNQQHSHVSIHGANLSLSIAHNVRNYACGYTPVCTECERLVESGVTVVVAAGNRGYQSFKVEEGLFENYAAFSITDPGNADGVITVGATHPRAPHSYGVSFFSSRGPTGDGRLKPDLVAPGERIQAPVSSDGSRTEWGVESGTSMAAPHVSGAAAMLMARYSELVGAPRRIKKILCESATDLGRERSFQGHGMLDVLRAFQSI
jgi:subtilisin family serine protease